MTTSFVLLTRGFVILEKDATEYTCPTEGCGRSMRVTAKSCMKCAQKAPVVVKAFVCPNCGHEHEFSEVLDLFAEMSKSPACEICQQDLLPEIHLAYKLPKPWDTFPKEPRAIWHMLWVSQYRSENPAYPYNNIVADLRTGPSGPIDQRKFDQVFHRTVENALELLSGKYLVTIDLSGTTDVHGNRLTITGDVTGIVTGGNVGQIGDRYVNTGGGSYHARDVNVRGGDVVGRDKKVVIQGGVTDAATERLLKSMGLL